MNYSQPHKYMLYYTEYEISTVYLSSMPSREDIINMLRKENQITTISQNYIDDFVIERPDGWYYKKIYIYAYSDLKSYLWKLEPIP